MHHDNPHIKEDPLKKTQALSKFTFPGSVSAWKRGIRLELLTNLTHERLQLRSFVHVLDVELEFRGAFDNDDCLVVNLAFGDKFLLDLLLFLFLFDVVFPNLIRHNRENEDILLIFKHSVLKRKNVQINKNI